jgi:hypothetical protein
MEITYRSGFTNWITVSDLRERMITALTTRKLFVRGNLSHTVQEALLKFTETYPDMVVIETSTRLTRTLESRASKITGQCPVTIEPEFMGISMVDARLAQVASDFAKTVRI